MRSHLAGLLALLALCAATATPVAALERETDRIEIDYVAPKSEDHAKLARQLQDNRVLEELRDFLSPFRLPASLTLKLESCGSGNAWYEDRVITVCYEYLDALVRHAAAEPIAPGVTGVDAIIGPTLEVFLHEMAHAAFELLEIPVLGREEDAADQVAAYMLLNLSKDQARRAVIGTASMYLREAHAFTAELTKFADGHGTPAQRYYNLLCLAYGSDAVLFADAVDNGLLPRHRAEDCAGEYKQVAFAFQTLIGPHLDLERIQHVRSRRWLDVDTATFATDASARARSKTD
jgi:hypothetical protein